LFSISLLLHHILLCSDSPFLSNQSRDDTIIRLNFEEVKDLDSLIAQGYQDWVQNAPANWNADGFLQQCSPIVVTSHFGQNARIATSGNEHAEADV
jgi:hypothetical protein